MATRFLCRLASMAAGLPLAIALVLTLDFAQAGLLSSLAGLGAHKLSRLAHGANHRASVLFDRLGKPAQIDLSGAHDVVADGPPTDGHGDGDAYHGRGDVPNIEALHENDVGECACDRRNRVQVITAAAMFQISRHCTRTM